MNRWIIIFIAFWGILLCSAKVGLAQQGSDAIRKDVPDQDKPWVPGDSPEQKQKEKDKLDEKKKKIDPNKPMTRRQRAKMLREEEKAKKKAYNEHHDKIQTKKTRKRMKENAKLSNNNNINKKPNIFKRIGAWFKKNKRKKSR